MAVRGRKRKATMIHKANGNPGGRALPVGEPLPEGRPVMPVEMIGRPLELWRLYIEPAFWLTAADGPKAWLWCHLQTEAEWGWQPLTPEYLDSGQPLPVPMNAPRIGKLMALGSELGFDPASRARLGDPTAAVDEDEDFFSKGQVG